MKFPNIDKPLSDPLEIIAKKIAKATHEFWMLDMARQGWRPGLETNEEKREHAWLLGFHRLPKEIQEQYIQKARAMPWIIYRAGLEMIFTAAGILDLFEQLMKSQRREHGTKKRQPRGASTDPKHRTGREHTVQQKEQGTSGEGAGEPGSGTDENPSSKAGGGSGPDRESSEGGSGKGNSSS